MNSGSISISFSFDLFNSFQTIWCFLTFQDEPNLESFRAQQTISMYRVPEELGGDKAASRSPRSLSSLYDIFSGVITLNKPTTRYVFQVDFTKEKQ